MTTICIPLDQCQHRHLYTLNARNLTLGVYNANLKAFIGIRTKLGSRFLDIEFHWDTGSPFGTACPLEDVGILPDSIEPIDGHGDPDLRLRTPNDELFTYLLNAQENSNG